MERISNIGQMVAESALGQELAPVAELAVALELANCPANIVNSNH